MIFSFGNLGSLHVWVHHATPDWSETYMVLPFEAYIISVLRLRQFLNELWAIFLCTKADLKFHKLKTNYFILE